MLDGRTSGLILELNVYQESIQIICLTYLLRRMRSIGDLGHLNLKPCGLICKVLMDCLEGGRWKQVREVSML